jgi:hypothetical protein
VTKVATAILLVAPLFLVPLNTGFRVPQLEGIMICVVLKLLPFKEGALCGKVSIFSCQYSITKLFKLF